MRATLKSLWWLFSDAEIVVYRHITVEYFSQALQLQRDDFNVSVLGYPAPGDSWMGQEGRLLRTFLNNNVLLKAILQEAEPEIILPII